MTNRREKRSTSHPGRKHLPERPTATAVQRGHTLNPEAVEHARSYRVRRLQELRAKGQSRTWTEQRELNQLIAHQED